MKPVDYDLIAPAYERRYATNRFAGIDACLRAFLAEPPNVDVAEVGCGTGHWLEVASTLPHVERVAGLDRSWAMLSQARAQAPSALLVRGTAHELPWAAGSFDRVVCINALHHFPDHSGFFRECARVVRPGGAVLTVGLDPHTGVDRWWIYDYFPAALAADLVRYPAAATIRAHLEAAGFARASTTVAQHIPARRSFESADAQGLLDRRSTSQLMVISDDEWKAGIARLRSERPDLHADLRLYATIAHA